MNTEKVDDKIVLCLCTLKRHEQLKEALDSLTRVALPDDAAVEFVLVDNDKNKGAKYVFDANKGSMPFNCHYFVEEKRGLSNVRNRAIDEALNLGATAIAMFDDDEIVTNEWLVELYNAFKNNKLGGVAGTTYRLLPIGSSKLVNQFWPNNREPENTEIKLMPTGNCMFSAELVHPDAMAIRFDSAFNFSGREDLAFSFDAQLKGAKFASAPKAIVIEKFTKNRSTFRYLVKRWFENGESDVAIANRYKFKKTWRTIVELLSIPCRIILLPFSMICGKKSAAKNILKLFASLGWICGIAGKSAKYYLKKN